MPQPVIFYADRPSSWYLGFLIAIAVSGSLSLPVMLWLAVDAFLQQNWALFFAVIFSALISAGMAFAWKGVQAALRQRRDASLHSISIGGGFLTYQNHDLFYQIPLVDILSVGTRIEPGGRYSGTWSVEIEYRKPDGSHSRLWISKTQFSKVGEGQGNFTGLLKNAIEIHRTR